MSRGGQAEFLGQIGAMEEAKVSDTAACVPSKDAFCSKKTFHKTFFVLCTCFMFHVIFPFPRTRSEGFLFFSGGSGGGTVFVSILAERPRTSAVCPMRCALRIGLYRGCLVAV